MHFDCTRRKRNLKAIRNGILRNKKEMVLLNRRGYSRNVQVCKNIFCKEQKRILLLHQWRMERALWQIQCCGSKKPLHLPVGSQFVSQGCPFYFTLPFWNTKIFKKKRSNIFPTGKKIRFSHITRIKACIRSSEMQCNIYCLTVNLNSFQHFTSPVL